jgi:hypothetical protein
MRVWSYVHPPEPPRTRPALRARGLYLMHLEFLTRHPSTECVVTAWSPWTASLAALFPKTFFQVYGCPTVTEGGEQNVLWHAAPFDRGNAEALGASARQVSLLFCGEDNNRQLVLYTAARPTAALLLLTAPPEHYLAGELLYPLWCAPDSHVAALVPRGGSQAAYYDARVYAEGMAAFHQTKGGDYDHAMETLILRAYAGRECTSEVGELLAEIVRAGLPPADGPELLLA